jgi:hypothetical protein
MESIYHIVAIRVNETSWAHVWRLRSLYLGTGYDTKRSHDSPQTLTGMKQNIAEDAANDSRDDYGAPSEYGI